MPISIDICADFISALLAWNGKMPVIFLLLTTKITMMIITMMVLAEIMMIMTAEVVMIMMMLMVAPVMRGCYLHHKTPNLLTGM